MNRAMLAMFGLLISGLIVTLIIVLETAPTPQEKAARATTNLAKAK